ncbi:hypothetical protein H0H87_011684 [Tephrocybe sp. NHM501043]|nr:hypothetical protein H0H87_011684 [Tephrocybe sp. NHM501043]
MSIFNKPSGNIQIIDSHFIVNGSPNHSSQDETPGAQENTIPVPVTEITHNFKKTQILSADTFSAVRAAFARNGTRIVAASNRSSVIIWDLDDDGKWRQASRTDLVEGTFASLIKISPDGSRVAVGPRTADYSVLLPNDAHTKINDDPSNKSILVWDTRKSEISHVYGLHDYRLVDMALSKDGSKVAAGFFHDILLWELQNEGYSGSEVKEQAHGGAIFPINFSPNGKKVVSLGAFDKSVKIWQYFDGGSLGLESSVNGEYGIQDSVVTALALSDHGKLAVGFQDGRVTIISTDGDDRSSEKHHSISHGGCVTELLFSADGLRLAVCSVDGLVQLWDVATGKPCSKPLKAQDSVDSMALSMDERKLLTVDRGGRIAVWELQ